MIKKRAYSREEKLKAIHLVLDKKKSARQVGLEMCIPNPHTVQDWVKKYKLHGEDILRAAGLLFFMRILIYWLNKKILID